MYKNIEVFEIKTNKRVASYLADSSFAGPTKVQFYYNGAEAGFYSPAQCYHIEEQHEQGRAANNGKYE